MKLLAGLLAGVVLVASTALSAVSDEEIQKMEQAMPAKAVVQPAAPRTLLVFNLSNGFKHSCIPYWQKALEIMGQKTGAFKVENSSDMSVFNAESLRAFDAICFNNTTNLAPDAAQQKAILGFIESGKGIVGIHAATDNFGNWPEGTMMMGGVFKGHPWTAGGTWAIKIDDPQHPLMKPFEGKGFKVNDEIYRTLPPQYSRTNQRVLMSLDMSDPATKNAEGVTPEDADTGISWIKPVGKGRLFYCSLGHNHHLTWTTPVLEHYLAGIQYALGDLKVDDTPVKAETLDGEKVSALVEQIRAYDWDKSRAPLAAMEALVRAQSGNPESLKLIEGKVLEALQAESTLAAKDFFCRMLAIVGTEDSVPLMAKMLKDDATFNIALFALDGISGQKAESTLIETFSIATKPEQKAGLITALAKRKSEKAVVPIAALMSAQDAAVAEAAIEALGAIGTEEAAKALEQAKVSPDLQIRVQDALLRCANSVYAAGDAKRAQAIYGNVYAGAANPVINAGALLGLSKTSDPKANEYVLNALSSDDPMLVRAAAAVISRTEEKALLGQSAAAAEKLSAQGQVQLVTALSENKTRIGGSVAEKLGGSENKDVRIAAYQALTTLGDEKAVLLLASAAGKAEDRDERQAAQDALYRLPNADVAIVHAIADEKLDVAVRVEMIQAAAQRQVKSAGRATLYQTARSSNPQIAKESIRALQTLAAPEAVEALTILLIEQPGTDTENALTAAAMQIKDAKGRAGALLERYGNVKEPRTKASLLRVMGKLGDPEAVSMLEREFRSTDPVMSEAAFRGMSDWPGTEFTGKMKEIAQGSTDPKQKVLAFRAFVRMLGTDSTSLIDAFKMAERSEEKKAIISALANSPTEQSMSFLQTLLDNPELKTEAEMSLLSVCEKLGSSNSDARAVLRELAANGSSEMIRRRASRLLR